MYNDHTRDPKFVAIVGKWSLLLCVMKFENKALNVGRYSEMAVNSVLYFHSMVRKPVVNLDAILSCQFLRPLGIGLSLGEESP